MSASIAALALFIFASHICVLTFAMSIPKAVINNQLCPDNQIYLRLPGLISGCYPRVEKINESCLRNEQCMMDDSYCGFKFHEDNGDDNDDEHVCVCKDGFVKSWNNSTCEPYLKCSRKDFNPEEFLQEDCGMNQFCRYGTCLCKPGYWFNNIGVCEWYVPDIQENNSTIYKSENVLSQIHSIESNSNQPTLSTNKQKPDKSSMQWKHLFIVLQLGFGSALVIALFVLWKRAKYQEEDDQQYQKIVDSIYSFAETKDNTKLANIEENETFHDANNGDPIRYQFGQKGIAHYWFKHSISDNHVAPLYQDDKQNIYDELVLQLEEDLMNHQAPERDFAKLECSRLIQSFIEVMQIFDIKLPCDKIYQFTDWFRQMLTENEKKETLNFEIATLLEQLYQYMQLSPTTSNVSKCHNISVIVLALFKCHYFQYSEIEHFLFYFIKKHIRPKIFVTEPLLILSTFDCFEKLEHRKQLLLDNPSIISAINWWVELFGHMPPLSRLYHMSPGDFQRLQAGMCAKWLRDHVLGNQELKQTNELATLNSLDRTENLKLSSDCFAARSDCFDRNKWQSIRSVRPATLEFLEDTFYFEAILFTDGPMRIGWATKHTDLCETTIGNDKFSVAYDGYNQCVISNGTKFTNTKLSPESRWSPGDVVGCLIDFIELKFTFYLNGKILKISLPKNIGLYFFNKQSYYAAISLSAQQQCYINFGQAPFRHRPKGIGSLMGSFQRKPNQAPSSESSLSMCYPTVEVFAHHPDQIDLVFGDSEQKQFEVKVKQIERIVLHDKVVDIEFNNEEECLRLIQAAIQVSGKSLEDKLDLLAGFIDQIIHESTNEHVHFPDLLCQVLYPLFSLHLNSKTATIHRNVCLVLSSLITVINDLKGRVNLYNTMIAYLTEIVIKSDEFYDEWMLIFALISFGNLDLNEEEKKILRENNKFCNNVDPTSGKQFDVISAQVLQQYEMCTHWFVDHTTTQSLPGSSTNESAILNPSDKSSHIKLSHDMLTVRSDHNWQSIRSKFQVNPKLNVVIFEVTLHTNGPMRIGWATSRTDLSLTSIGGDKNSIAFDGYNQCIWHNNKRIELMTINNEVIPRWKSGDIVGCLVNVSANTFSFYLNQQPVYFHPLGYFAKLHNYFAAVSLPTFQQCRFNFGKIKYPPNQPEFYTFNSQLLNLRKSAEKLFNNIHNSFIQIGSKADINGSVRMQQLIDETLKLNP